MFFMNLSGLNRFIHSKHGKLLYPILIGLSIYLINSNLLAYIFYLYPATIPLTIGKGSILDMIQRDYQFIAGEKIQDMFAEDLRLEADKHYEGG
jgi:hypothetical protein